MATTWRRVFREGFCPSLSTEGLEALLAACESNDPRLMQGATTAPPPLNYVDDWPIEATDAIGFTEWRGREGKTVRQIHSFFARVCFECDERLEEPAACRWFLNFFDDTRRDVCLPVLAKEIRDELAARREKAGAA